MVGRPPRVTEDQYRRIMAVRDARAGIPSDKVLARELGITVSTLRSIMWRRVKRFNRRA